MKILFASDIHGSAAAMEKILAKVQEEKADRFVLLGDLLYHGPRNDLPERYAPKEVFAMLNSFPMQPLCVRGNCDAEVDQMVLEFPILADYALLELNGKTIYATHGHVYNTEAMPPMQPGDTLIHGHTHLPVAEALGDKFWLNPGSTSLPKGGYPNSYGMLDGDVFTIYDFDGNVVKEIVLK